MSEGQLDPEDRLIAELGGAVRRGEIAAYYQPQIDVSTGTIVAVESLSRWLHPELGMQSPLVFIPIAEDFGLIDELGEFMIGEACRCAADFAARDIPIEVSVNVSALQLARATFFERLESEFAELQLAPQAITLEITESRLIANRPQVAKRLKRLRDDGVGVSIDDFGVGHSSVEQVLALPASELKIDRTIVQDETATDGALLATIVRLAKDRGLRTVAEGVETDEQLERVRSVGCDRAQGYLLGKPVPKDELDTLLRAKLG
jgi:EAL domain-containing protein (putative c-di-GMP-specific phosphodiesterase class I)